jgi:rod shape-determining protein MreD
MMVWAIVALYVQILIAPSLTLLRGMPELLLPFVVYLTISTAPVAAYSIIFFMGIAYDLTTPLQMGWHTFLFLLMALLVQLVHRSINKHKFAIVAVSLFVLNVLYYLLMILYFLLASPQWKDLLPPALFAVLYNSCITIFGVYLLLVIDRLRLLIDV